MHRSTRCIGTAPANSHMYGRGRPDTRVLPEKCLWLPLTGEDCAQKPLGFSCSRESEIVEYMATEYTRHRFDLGFDPHGRTEAKRGGGNCERTIVSPEYYAAQSLNFRSPGAGPSPRLRSAMGRRRPTREHRSTEWAPNQKKPSNAEPCRASQPFRRRFCHVCFG